METPMLKRILFIISLMLVYQTAYSHAGGHGPVDEKQAIAIASDVVEQFVDSDPGLGFGKLDKSWKNVAKRSAKIHKKGNGYYIVSILNTENAKTLYFLLSISGEVYDANFTGEFEGLK